MGERSIDTSLAKPPFGRSEIERHIPHRSPFLLIDEVRDLVLNQSIVASRTIRSDDVILQGHFPGNPILPGVLIIEAAAQAAGVLGRASFGKDCKNVFLMEVSRSRFRRIVVPGDELVFTVRVTKQRAPFYWFTGEAHVGAELAAEVAFSAKMF